MIAQLTGSLLRIEDDSTVIDVNGVGFRVAIPNAEMFSSHQIGDMVTLYTYLHVRENALSLYGFQTDEEKELFQVLIGVSGVGPKLALTMLSSLPMDTLRTAITTQRSDLLEVVPGIGRKTAQRILFDLHDKADLAAAIHLRESVSDVEQEVIDALKALGYRVNEILPALKRSKAAEAETTEERIRLALREMIQ